MGGHRSISCRSLLPPGASQPLWLRDDIRTFRVKQGSQGRLLPMTRKYAGGDSSPTSPEIPESRASPSNGNGEWIILGNLRKARVETEGFVSVFFLFLPKDV